MPIDPRRRDGSTAAVAAYDRDHPDAPLPRNRRTAAGRHVPIRGRVPAAAWTAIAGEVRPDGQLLATVAAPGRGRAPVQEPWLGPWCPTPTACTCRRCLMRRRRREKVFGPGRAVPLDRNAKARIAAYSRAWDRLHRQPGQRGGALGRATLDVLGALLWVFHNARSGCCFPSYETIAGKAGCARSTVAEAIKALEFAGVLTWQNRIVRIRERCRDLFGRVGWRWRVIRTSNAYVLIDPASKSDQRTGTPDQEDSKLLQAPAVDPNSPLERALARFAAALVTKEGIEQDEATAPVV